MENGINTGNLDETPTTFRLGYVPGVTPAKWVNLWKQRRPDTPIELIQLPALDGAQSVREGLTDMSLVRLPIDREGLHAIELYRETPVVVFPKEHHFAAADNLTLVDIADEVLQHPLDCPLDWDHLPGIPAAERVENTKIALEVVAAGVGVVIVPQSLARLHHRKDLDYRPIEGAPFSPVALVWPAFDENPEDVEEFIGIVRGRKASSSRAQRSNPDQQKAADANVQEAQKAERAARVAEKQKRRATQGKASRTGGTRAGSGRGVTKSGKKPAGGKGGTRASSKSGKGTGRKPKR